MAGLVVEPMRRHARRSAAPRRGSPASLEIAAAPPISASSSRPRPGPLSCRGVGFLDPLDRAALHEQALDRIERRELVVTRLQRPHFGGDAEQLADKVFEMRRQIDEKVRLRPCARARRARRAPPSAGRAARHRPRRDGRQKRGRAGPGRRDRKDRQRRARVSGRVRSWALVTRRASRETSRQIAATSVAALSQLHNDGVRGHEPKGAPDCGRLGRRRAGRPRSNA